MGTFRSAGGTAARRPQRGTRPRLCVPRSPQPRTAAPAAPAARAIGRAARPPPLPLPARLPAHRLPARPPPSFSPPRLVFPFSSTSGAARSLLRAMAVPRPAPALGKKRHSSLHPAVPPYRYNRCVRAQAHLRPATAMLRTAPPTHTHTTTTTPFRARAAEEGRFRLGDNEPLNSVPGRGVGGREGWAVGIGWAGSAGKGRTAESGRLGTGAASRR